jgi:hypothetical protein
MIDTPPEVARRMRRDAHRKGAERFWAGWKLILTFGPYELAFAPEVVAHARRATEKIAADIGHPGKMPTPEESIAAQQDVWHLSVSWRGGTSVEEGRRLLDELLVALGVPPDRRGGFEFAQQFRAGRPLAVVRHWVWHEASSGG